MKTLYEELNNTLGGIPVISLDEIAKEKELKGSLLVKFGGIAEGELESRPHEEVNDKRIKVLVADEDLIRVNEMATLGTLSRAMRILQTAIPDVKLYACGSDVMSAPKSCDGFLSTNPENAVFALNLLRDLEGLSVKTNNDENEAKELSEAGRALYCAMDLLKKNEYTGYNILVYLPELHLV